MQNCALTTASKPVFKHHDAAISTLTGQFKTGWTKITTIGALWKSKNISNDRKGLQPVSVKSSA